MSAPPTGTVTFLMTDVEGSTKLWENEPEAMKTALARHDSLMRQAIESCGGHIVKTMGDAFFAAFDTPLEAARAMRAAQRAITEESWAIAPAIKVRMALHTGAAELREGDYFGPSINRVARLLATAHGGQSLVSLATHGLLRDALPAEVTAIDLGEHRLKDLGQPERIYQLNFPGQPTEFPALRSLSSSEPKTNLPLQMTSFIGRETEIREVEELLKRSRLLTLTGSGGCGKTRLSFMAAASLFETFPDGVWLVELGPLSAPALVDTAVGACFGLKEEPYRAIADAVIDYLKHKRLLLILDNCEHLLAPCSALAERLLQACPTLQILATSREGLGIPGERTYRVPSLATPDDSAGKSLEQLASNESIKLFLDRADLQLPGFKLMESNCSSIVSICRRLDGIPLAIELAAARLRSLTAEEIDARLDQRFGLLTGGSRTLLPRQQTLRALVDWSFDLLNSEERSVLLSLSVFAGGWTLELAEQVCACNRISASQILDLHSGLVDKSLVAIEDRGGQTRYRLLETVRQYALERLEESGEFDESKQRHSEAYLAFAGRAEPKLRGPEQLLWIRRFEDEHENIRACMDWMFHSEDAEGCLRLCVLMSAWWQRGRLLEGREWALRATSMPGANAHPAWLSRALAVAGTMAWLQGDYGTADADFARSLETALQTGGQRVLFDAHLGRAMGHFGMDRIQAAISESDLALQCSDGVEPALIAWVVYMRGVFLRFEGDTEGAIHAFQVAIEHYRTQGDRIGLSFPLYDLALATYYAGDFEASIPIFAESLSIRRESNERWGLAESLYGLGLASSALGQVATARARFEESLSIAEDMGDLGRAALCQVGLGNLEVEQGDSGAAWVFLREGIRLFQQLGDRWGIARSFDAFAGLWSRAGDHRGAAQLWGAAESIRAETCIPLAPCERAMKERRMALSREALPKDAFQDAFDEGFQWSAEHAVEQVAAWAPAQPP